MTIEEGFIGRALADVRPLIQQKGFKAIRVKDILETMQVSQSKFFNYFGSIYGLFALVMHDELLKCYTFVHDKTKRLDKVNFLLLQFRRYKMNFVNDNAILQDYFTNEKLFTRRFDVLKKTVQQSEKHLLNEFLQNFVLSEDDVLYFKKSILNFNG